MKVEFRKSFEKDLRKIKDTELLQRIQSIVEEVENIDSLMGLINIKKLKAEGDFYRIRIGNYRVGLSLNNETVIFVCVLHRKEIYRYFP
jgi:mRNA interferase RelE/StbE